MSQLQIVALEAAINRCRLGVRTLGATVQPDLDALATLYGSMIYHRVEEISLESLDPAVQLAFGTWQERVESPGSTA